jgi:hypothetical protein
MLDVIGYTIDLSTSDMNARVGQELYYRPAMLHKHSHVKTHQPTTRTEAGVVGHEAREDLPGDAAVLRGAQPRNMGSD